MNRLEWAIYDAVHDYGVRALAEKMRISPQVLINKVNPEQEGHALTFDQFVLVMELTKSQAILDALHERAGLGPQDCEPSLTLAVIKAAKESSDVLAVFERESQNGVWSMSDARALEQEAMEATTALSCAVASSWALANAGGRIGRG